MAISYASSFTKFIYLLIHFRAIEPDLTEFELYTKFSYSNFDRESDQSRVIELSQTVCKH